MIAFHRENCGVSFKIMAVYFVHRTSIFLILHETINIIQTVSVKPDVVNRQFSKQLIHIYLF